MKRASELGDGTHLEDTVNAACTYCVCRKINTFFRPFLIKQNKQEILTVFRVNTSSGDFIQDHVLGTTGKAALHTANYINIVNS